MRNYIGLIFSLILALSLPTACLAQSSIPVEVEATVGEQLDLSMWIKQLDEADADPGTDGIEVTTMRFGTLTDTFDDGTSSGTLFSKTWFGVFLVANTSGRAYYLRQSAESLTNSAGDTIPDNCFLMHPDYIKEDKWLWPGGSQEQGPMPPGASLGAARSAVGDDLLIYTSESAGTSHILRCYYAVTNGYKSDGTPWEGFSGKGIPFDQPGGDYDTTVTFSVVLQ